MMRKRFARIDIGFKAKEAEHVEGRRLIDLDAGRRMPTNLPEHRAECRNAWVGVELLEVPEEGQELLLVCGVDAVRLESGFDLAAKCGCTSSA
jgi:hypothetical protein